MSHLLKSTFIVMFLAGVSKLMGLLRETTMASAYGVSDVMDAFLVAILLPQFMSSLMQSGVLKAFVSLYHETDSERGPQAAGSFTKTLLCLTFGFGVVLYMTLDSLSAQLLHLVAPGFTEEKLRLTSSLLNVMMPCFIFMASTDILSAYQQAKGSFTYSTSGPIVLNITTVLMVILLANAQGIYAAATAYLISAIVQFFVQVYGSYKCGLWSYLKFELNLQDSRKFAVLIMPILAGIAFSQANTLIDRFFASWLPEGSISALNYSYKVHWLVIAFFVVPFSTAFFPALAELYNRERTLFQAKVRRLASLLMFIALPISVLAIILSHPIISVIYQRGAFHASDVTTTSEVLVCYLIGLVFQVLVILLLDVAYVMQKSKLVFTVVVIMAISNATFNYLVVDKFAAPGLAVSTSVSQLIGCILLYTVLVLRYKVFDFHFLVSELAKVAGLCIVPGLLTAGWRYLTVAYGIKPYISLAVGAAIFGSTFFITALLSKRPEISDIIDLIQKRPIYNQVKTFLRLGGLSCY